MELYDLQEDPGEENNIASAHPEIAERIRSIMDRARTDSPDFQFGAGKQKVPAAEKPD